MRCLAAVYALAVSLMLLPACARALDIVIDGIDPGIQGPPDKNAPLPEGAIAKSGVAPASVPAETPALPDTKVALSPDGSRAATAADDGSVRIWDSASAKLLATIKAHQRECRDVRFSTDGKTLFSCSADSTVRQWDAATGKELRKLEGGEGDVRSLACSPDGLRLVASDAKGIRVWDLKSGKQLRLITGHKIPPEFLAAQQAALERANNDDDDVVAIGGNVIIQGGVIAVGGGEPLSVTVDALVYSPDGRTLVSEANDETARIWDTLNGKELRILPHHDGASAAVAMSPDGILGVSTRGAQQSGTAQRLRLWEVATGRILRTFLGHSGDINCDAFSPDGRYVVSGANDGTLRQWEVDSGVEVRRYYLSSHVMSVAYGPSGTFAVTVSPNEGVVIWDMAALPVVHGMKVAVASLDDAWQSLASPLYEARSAAFRYYCKKAPAEEAVADLQRRLTRPADDPAARAAQRRLVETLDDPEYTNRATAYRDLAELGDKARAELVAALDHSSPEVRARAGELLAAIGGLADFRAVVALEILFTLKTPAAKAALEAAASSKLPSAAHAKALLARLAK